MIISLLKSTSTHSFFPLKILSLHRKKNTQKNIKTTLKKSSFNYTLTNTTHVKVITTMHSLTLAAEFPASDNV